MHVHAYYYPLIQNILNARDTVAGRNASGVVLGKASLQVNLVVRRQEPLVAKVPAPVDDLIDERHLLTKLLGDPLRDQ